MGAIGSALAAVAAIAQPFYQDSIDRKETKKQNELALQQAQQSAAIQQEQLRAQNLQAEEQRRTLLKRSVAKQRASYGSQGISSGDGSSEAVLLGMFNESDEERAMREQMTGIRSAAIDLNAGQIQQRNLLEQAKQQQQQAINRITDLF